jgi:type II secretory pathway predicted ATPase ExeA
MADTSRSTQPSLIPNRSTIPGPAGAFDTQSPGMISQLSYPSFFTLRGYPFSDIRQPANYWDAGPYADAVRQLTNQIEDMTRPILFLGPPGSGKTFTCEMLQHKIPGAHVFTVEPQLLFGAKIFFILARQVGVTLNATASTRLMIEAFLNKVLPKDEPNSVAVVVIDSVDPADRDLLAELGTIVSTARTARFTLILIGPEGLPEALSLNGAPQSLLPVQSPVVVRPMTQQEMAAYVDFRMTEIGGASGFKLDDATRQILHARSGGNPKLVNIYCHNALTLAVLKQETTLQFDTLRMGMRSKTYLTPDAARALLTST